MSWKRGLLGLGLCLTGLLVLLHSQLVERALWARVVNFAREQGWEVSASRFDLHLVPLGISLLDLKVKGPGVDAAVDSLDASAYLGLLTGSLDFKSLSLGKGYLHLDAEGLAKLPHSESEGEPPEIHADRLEIGAFVVRYEDLEIPIAFAAQELTLAYGRGRLKLGLELDPIQQGERLIPKLKLALGASTMNFLDYQDIDLKLISEKSQIEVKGRLGFGMKPDLKAHLDLGEDLLPELPGLSLDAALDENWLHASLTGAYLFESGALPFTLKAGIPYREKVIRFPLLIEAEGVASGSLNVSYNSESKDLTGILDFGGDLEGLRPLLPNLKLEGLELKSEIQMPGLDPAKLSGQMKLKLAGWPSANLSGEWHEGVLGFSGQARLSPGTNLDVKGSFDGTVRADLATKLAKLSDLSPLWVPPAELKAKNVTLKARISGNFQTWRIEKATVQLGEVGFLPYLQSAAKITASGALDKLNFRLEAPGLRPEGAAASGVLNLPELEWKELELQFDTSPIQIADFQVKARLQAKGKGPLVATDFSGQLDAELLQEGRIAQVRSGVHFFNNKFDFKDLQLTSALGTASGSGQLDLSFKQDRLLWNADLAVDTKPIAGYKTLYAGPLPLAHLDLKGDQDKITTQLSLPAQRIFVENLDLPVQLGEGALVRFLPEKGLVTGNLPSLQIAGVAWSDLTLKYQNKRLKAEAGFDLKDPALLSEILKPLGLPEDLDIAALTGQLTYDSGVNFEQPQARLYLDRAEGSFGGEPLSIHALQASYGPGLILSPFTMVFAGLALQLSSGALPGSELVPLTQAIDQPFFDLSLGFQLKDPAALQRFFGGSWPDGLGMHELKGSARLRTDASFSQRSQALYIERLGLDYAGHKVDASDINMRLEEVLWISPFKINIDGQPIEAQRMDRGLRLSEMALPENWVPNLVGDARFSCEIQAEQLPEGVDLRIILTQSSGKTVYLDPFLEVEELRLVIHKSVSGKLEILPSTAIVNGGTLKLEGDFDLSSEVPQFRLQFSGDKVDLDLADIQTKLSAVLEWRGDTNSSDLRGVVTVNDSYISPKIDVESLLQDFLAETTELYFPDPFLEMVNLQIVLLTEKPAIMDTNLGYVELESPALLIGGSLAEPMPISGSVSLSDGSTLTQRNKTYLFQNSSIQFHPNRIGDPYLLLTIAEQSSGESPKDPIFINGYVSDLNTSLDGSGITGFLVNYLLSKVSSIVSFEVEVSDDFLSKSTFTSVVSRTITPRLIVRYQIPYNQLALSRALELRAGPYRSNYVKITDNQDGVTYGLSHLTKFGVKDRGKKRIKKIKYGPEKITRSLKHHFQFEAGEAFSETRWRRANYDVRRTLRQEGYFKPTLSYQFENGVLVIHMEKGEKTDIRVKMTGWTIEDQQSLLRKIPAERELDLRHLERLCQRIAISKGFPSAAAFAQRDGDRFNVRVLVSHKITQVNFDFTNANGLLAERYKEAEKRKALLLDYLTDQSLAEGKIRAQLAAKGYLLPEIGQGDFTSVGVFQIPIKLGPRARLTEVRLNGAPWESAYLNQAFAFPLLEKVTTELNQRVPGRNRITVRAVRDNQDLRIEAKSVPIESNLIEQLDISGTERLSPKSVRRFFGRKPVITQTELLEGQEKLVETRTFEMVRLQLGSNKNARLELIERNPWDLTLETNWNKEEEFGYSAQFTDRMFLHRLAKLTSKVERSKKSDKVNLGVDIRRIFGTRFDYLILANWMNDRIPDDPVITRLPINNEVNYDQTSNQASGLDMALSWKSGKRWSFDSGFSYLRTKDSTHTTYYLSEDDIFTDDEIFDSNDITSVISKYSINSAISYGNLDSEILPNKGYFLSLSAKYLLGNSENGRLSAPWLLGKAAIFEPLSKSLTWSQLYEMGWYSSNLEGASTGLVDPTLSDYFYLGGSKSVRGIAKFLMGPLSLKANEDGEVTATPLGGESMFHFSHELFYNIHFNGLGFSPFVDGGWVWSRSDQLFSSGLAVTGGLGLVWDLPVGRLRIDYAEILERSPYAPLTEDPYLPVSWEELGKAIEQKWTLRFGRIF